MSKLLVTIEMSETEFEKYQEYYQYDVGHIKHWQIKPHKPNLGYGYPIKKVEYLKNHKPGETTQ